MRILKEELDNNKVQHTQRIQFLETELRNKESTGSSNISKLQLELEEKKLLIVHLESEKRKANESLSKLKQSIQVSSTFFVNPNSY